MEKSCNVIPQIKVGNNAFEDSKLFIELWDKAKQSYPKDSVKAREEAIRRYNYFKSKDFRVMFGDWLLLHKYNNGLMNTADFAAFSSIYGNDLSRLTNSISIKLNEQGEPDLKSFSEQDTTKKSLILYDPNLPFLSDSEQNYINCVFSSIVFRLEPKLQYLRVGDFKRGIKVRGEVAKVLRQYAAHNYDPNKVGYKSYEQLMKDRFVELVPDSNWEDKKMEILYSLIDKKIEETNEDVNDDNINEFIKKYNLEEEADNLTNDYFEPILNKDILYKSYKSKKENLENLAEELESLDKGVETKNSHHVWESFINYYKATFYSDILDFDVEDDLLMGELRGDGTALSNTDGLITKSFNNKNQFTVNRKNTASSDLKVAITQLIYGNQSNLFNTPKDIEYNGTAEFYHKYGLVMPFDINILWNDLIKTTWDSSDRNDLLNKLHNLSVLKYNGQLEPLIEKMRINDPNNSSEVDAKNIFYNSYMKSVDLALTNVSFTETEVYNEKENGFSKKYVRKIKNRESYLFERAYDVCRHSLMGSLQYAKDRSIINAYKKITVGESFSDKINAIILKSYTLGINITLDTILNYVSLNYGYPIDDVISAYSNGLQDSNRASVIIEDLNRFIKSLDDIVDYTAKYITDKQDDKSKTKQSRDIGLLFKKGFTLNKEGDIVAEGVNKTLDIDPIVNDMKNWIYNISKILASDYKIDIDLSYINVEGQQEYTPEFHNHITYMLQGIVNSYGKVNEDLLLIRFEDFYTSSSMNHNKIIWDLGDGRGFFIPEMKNGEIVKDANGVNKLAGVNVNGVISFKYARFNGVSNVNNAIGTSYVDMHDYKWINDVIMRQMDGDYSLPSADASRIYDFTTGNYATDSVDKFLHMFYFNKKGYLSDYKYLINPNNPVGSIENNFTYKMVKHTFLGELERMNKALHILFDINPITKALSIKSEYLRSKEDVHKEWLEYWNKQEEKDESILNRLSEEAYYEKHKLDYAELSTLPSPAFWNGESLLENGKPTGNIFKFSNLNFRYINEKGEVEIRDITHYINTARKQLLEEKGENSNINYGNKPEAYEISDSVFYDNYNSIIDRAFLLMFIDRTNSHIFEMKKMFDPIKTHIQSSSIYLEQFAKQYYNAKDKYASIPRDLDNVVNYKDDRHYSFALANMDLNHYIADVSIQELFTGFNYEFTSALDWAKRASQNVRLGAHSRSNEEYTQIIVEDVKLFDNMLDLFAPRSYDDSESDLRNKKIRERFYSKITTTDAFNVITEQEAIRRFKEMGDYSRFTLPSGNTLEDLVNEDKDISIADYEKIVEQLKYYVFKRGKLTLKNSKTDFIFSHQDKNSTVVIFKKMYKGTMYETLAQWMEQEHIDSINFASGHKVGSLPKVKLFTIENDGKDPEINAKNAKLNIIEKDGKLVLSNYPKGIDSFKHTIKYDNVYQQQQIPSHLKDETNKIGTQLEKRILDGIKFTESYLIKGEQLKGSTGKKNWEDAGVFERYQMTLSACAQDEMYRLLSDWGALDDEGNIKYRTFNIKNKNYQLVDVNMGLVLSDLREYFNSTEIDRNFIKACVEVDGRPLIPFFHPTIQRRIESVLLAKITKRITNLKMKGAHLTIQPDTFMSPTKVVYDKDKLIKGTQENINRLIKDGAIKFSDDYWRERAELDENGNILRDNNGNPIIKKNADFKLKSEHYTLLDGSPLKKPVSEYDINELKFHPAEIILNNWDSRFKLDENGYLDLNSIPESLRTIFGIRIPTEGHQSMFVAKVVGVLNNGASQAILPEHLITRTGWDFDIDSVYLSFKEFEVINNNYVEYTIDESNDLFKKQSLEYVADVYFKKQKHEIYDKYLSENISLINDIIDKSEILSRYDNRGKRSDDPVSKLSEELKDLKAERFYSRDKNRRAELDKLIIEKTNELNEFTEGINESTIADKDILKLKSELKSAIIKLNKAKKEYEKNYNEFLNTVVIKKWETLDLYHKAPRAAKDNYIIDTWIGIHTDDKSLMLSEQPNEFKNSSSSANYINTIAGYDNKSMNQHFIVDQLKIRNINNNIAVLKGQSIAMDNAMSIFGVIGGRLNDDLAIPFAMTFESLDGYKKGMTQRDIENILNKTYKQEKIINNGKEKNVYTINMASKKITIFQRNLNNNDYGTWTDINGQYISEQRRELTSHVLDAVKENMAFNCNTYTLGNKGLLISFPISFKINLEHNGKTFSGINRFIYSDLIESQKIIVNIVEDISTKSLEDDTNYTNISFNNARSNFVIKALASAIYSLKSINLKDIVGEYFNITKDNNNISGIINAIGNIIQDENFTINNLNNIHKVVPFIKGNQLKTILNFLKYINEKAGIMSYEYDSEIEFKCKTVEELDSLFKKGIKFDFNISDIKDYADWCNRQLEILDYYEYCDKGVNAIKRAQGVLITEKKGAGPKTSESYKLFESIADLDNNITSLEKIMKTRGVPESMINEFLYKYHTASDVIEKRNVVTEEINKINIYLSNLDKVSGKKFRPIERPKPPILVKSFVNPEVNDVSLVEAVFPSLYDESKDAKDSVYPILQQQLISTNELSTKLFSNLFLNENPAIRDAMNYIAARFHQTKNPEFKEKFLSYAIMHTVKDLPFFQDLFIDTESVMDVKEEERLAIGRANLLGVLDIKEGDNENDPKFSGDLDFADSSINLKYWSEDGVALTHDEKLKRFKKFPVAIQLKIVQNTLFSAEAKENNNNGITITGSTSINPNHILSLLTPILSMPTILKNQYIPISYRESFDLDYTRDSVYQILNSPDEFIRTLGENLVRYTFLIYGFDFGRNMSKGTPTDLFGVYKRNIGTDENGNPILMEVSPFKVRWGDDYDNINFEQIDGTSDAEMRKIFNSRLGEGRIFNGGITFRDPNKALYHYSSLLYKALTNEGNILLQNESVKNKLMDWFAQANFNNNRLIPLMQKKYKGNTSELVENSPRFEKCTKATLSKLLNPSVITKDTEKWAEGIDENFTSIVDKAMANLDFANKIDPWKVASDIIIEPKSRIDNSKYADNIYLKTKEDIFDRKSDIVSSRNIKYLPKGKLYKRIEMNDCYVYYPIPKTFKFEYGYTCNKCYKWNIYDKDYYEQVGKILTSNINDYTLSINKLVKSNSTTEAIQSIIKDNDAVIIIGNEDSSFTNLIQNEANTKKGLILKEVDSLETLRVSSSEFKISIDKSSNLALISNFKNVSESERSLVQADINRALNSLLSSLQPAQISVLKTDKISEGIIKYISYKQDIDTNIYTIKEDLNPDIKYSVALDMNFEADKEHSAPVSALNYMSMLHDIEENAIGNTPLLRQELSIVGGDTKVLKELEAKSRNILEKLPTDIDEISSYIDTLDYNFDILNEVYNIIALLKYDISDDYLFNIFKNNDNDAKKEFLINTYKIKNLILSQEYIDKLDYVDEYIFEKVDEGLKEHILEFNEKLKSLKQEFEDLKRMRNIVDEGAKLYFGYLMAFNSRNPYFKNRFKHLQDQLAEKGYDISLIDPYTLTPKDVAENITKMLSDNIDIDFLTYHLDSAAQSGIPLMDTVLNHYEYYLIDSEEWAYKTNNKAIKLFEKYALFNPKDGDKVRLKYSKSRNDLFKSKFIDKNTNQLLTPFDFVKANEDTALMIAMITDKYFKDVEEVKNNPNITDLNGYLSYLVRSKNKNIGSVKNTYFRNITLELPAESDHVKIEEALKLSNKILTPKAYRYYVHLVDRYMRSNIKTKFGEVNNMSVKVVKKNTIAATIRIPDPLRYKNPYYSKQFDSLTDEDIDMLLDLQELFLELNNIAMPNTIKLPNFYPSFISSKFGSLVKEFFGLQDLQEDDYRITLAGETQYYLKASALNKPKIIGLEKIDYHTLTDESSYKTYIETVNKNKKNYDEEIKTLADVIKYNRVKANEQTAKIYERMNYDPVNTVHSYIEQLKRIKVNRDFEPELLLLQTLMRSKEFKARGNFDKNKNVVNKILSLLTHKTQVKQNEGSDTKAYQRLKGFMDTFEGKNRINTFTDQLISVLYTSNSKSLMWFNFTSALKNIGTGHINIVSNAVGGEMLTQKDLWDAHADYLKNATGLLASLGEYESDSITVALMKIAGNIFEDHNEASQAYKDNPISTSLAKWDNAAYFMNTAGDHYLQFTTYLGMLRSHRVVGDAIMNFEQFTRSIRESVLRKLMNEDQTNEFNEYIKSVEKYRSNNISTIDYISKFLVDKGKTVTTTLKKEYTKLLDEELSKAKEEFKKYITVKDAFELKEGRASIKEDVNITMEEFSKFLSKVKGVNHSLHGIYNTFDKSLLAGKMWGEVILQFRKWLRPNFIRYFGKRIGETMFDERFQSYRSGVYSDAISFIFHYASERYRNSIKESIKNKDNTFIKAFKAMCNFIYGSMLFAKDISFRYKVLPESKKANIRSAAFNFMTLVGLSIAACLLYNAGEDDDELDENLAFAILCYFIYGIQTELYETNPLGIYSFYKRTMENPVPFEATLNNFTNYLKWLIAGFFMDEEDLIYDRGSYKGEDKRWIAFKKLIPVMSQYNKLVYLPSNNTYYMKQNPILQMITKYSKD